MENFEPIRELAHKPGACECGRTHRLLTRDIRLEHGALRALPETVRRFCPGRTARIVCDENTYAAAGKDAAERMKNAGCQTLVFPDGIVADEAATQRLDAECSDSDCLIAVGSGTIHDICRYIAARRRLGFISVPTAPSVDGFVSSVAAMTFGGCKVTTPAVPPAAVVADTAILARAPRRLIAAGAGDILGKFTCLCDWEISSLVTEETFCRPIARIESDAARGVLRRTGELAEGSESAVSELMAALLASGLAMQLNGDSRPASGAEHHLSHFWEMRFLREGRAPALHGAKVGVATVIVADIYHRAAGLFRRELQDVRTPGVSEDDLRRVFGPAADGIMRENTPDPYAAVDFRKLSANRQRIASAIDALPSSESFAQALAVLGGPVRPADLGIDDALTAEGERYCIYVRRRMTLLRLLTMIGRPER